MMIGVAQVIGMKPTLRSFFSGAPPWAKASRAAPSGRTEEIAAIAVAAPDRLQEQAALGVDREDRAQDGGIDDPVPPRLLARRHRFGRQASMLGRRHDRRRSRSAARAGTWDRRDP